MIVNNLKRENTQYPLNKKGFTIIEVVLVLAIAGLIFLMVFIAIPALQRSQRNTQRSNDLSRFLAAIDDYKSKNHGQLPFTSRSGDTETIRADRYGNFIQRYLDNSYQWDIIPTSNSLGSFGIAGTNCSSEFVDPDGTCYRVRFLGQVKEEGSLDRDSDNVWANTLNHNYSTVTGSGKTLHEFNVIQGAACGDSESDVKKASGKGIVAVYLLLEGDSIACRDNS